MNNDFALPAIEWSVLMPILIVSATGIVALVIEMLAPRRNNNVVVGTSLIGLVVAAVSTLGLLREPAGMKVANMVAFDHFGTALQFLMIVACGVSFLFSERYLREKRIAFAEFYPLALWATAGGMVMVTTTNLLMVFLGLEILSIALYCLVGMSRREQKSEESAIKYFLLGAFASAFFLFGVAMFFGATGSLDLSVLGAAVELGVTQYTGLIVLGVALMSVGMAFKTALVPFHQWTPDVYQGAPTNVTAFMSAVSKIAAFGAFARILEAAVPLQEYWFAALSTIAVLTMVIGNLFALAQKDVKRILAYSSVAHAGYVLVGLLAHVKAPDKVPLDAVVLYLGAYSAMTIGAFAVLTLLAKGDKEGTRLQDLNGLWKASPFAAGALAVFMFSLVGIPPTAGFFGKYMIFVSALDAGLQPLAYVLAVSSVISVYYYLAVVRSAWIEEEGIVAPPRSQLSPGLGLALVVCLVGVLGMMVFARPALSFSKATSAQTLRLAEPVGAEGDR